MSYPGTYLKTEKFEVRYKIVADFLGDATKRQTVLDLNCGEPLFRKYIKCGRYYCNDVWIPDNIPSNLTFYLESDDKIDIKSHILCCFGYGGGEHTKHPLESKTCGDSIVRLAEYKPKYIVLEMAQKWEDDFKIMSGLKERLPDYKLVFEKKLEIEPAKHYHDKRLINILKHK